MKQLTLVLAILFGFATGALANDKSLEERVEALENNIPNLPQGFFCKW